MPTVAEALQIGWQQHQAGQLRAAEHVYRQVLQVAPSDENAWCFLGMACHDQGRYQEAIQAYQQALAIKPDFPVALSNRGNTLKELGRLDDAEASCREALRVNPEYSTAYNNLGAVLVAKGELDQARAAFERALSLMPADAVTRANLAAALVRQGDFEQGTTQSQEALKIDPKYAEAHKNLGIVWLLQGDFERGWAEYEWRWKCAGTSLPALPQPLWDGSPLAGRTILLVAEQGLGDTIHFIRYAPLLAQTGATVIVACQKPLLKLLARCPGVARLVPQGGDYPACDVWAPLLSLPRVLGTNLASIPAEVPYLEADPELVESWRRRLASYDGFRVGIAWQGSPDFHADRHRSLPLRHFARLAQIPGVRLFSLQKGYGAEQIGQLDGAFEVIDFGDELDAQAGAFVDTAAIMRNLDLIVSSDTAVPHLAGALAVEAWMAVSLSPDWRWLLDRDDSPWYPTLRLFRQQALGDWEGVFERLAAELQPRVRLPASPPAAPQVLHSAGVNRLQNCRHGVMLFNQHDIYIGRSLEQYGEFSEAELELLGQFVGPGDVVVDAGANIGTHTVPLARRVGETGRVYAFEPQRIVFQTLCANVALNGLRNVDCRPQALGGAAGQVIVPPLDYAAENNFGGLGLGQYTQGERVPVTTIDALELPACRLIKIDVEGMEAAVLDGARGTIEKHRPLLYVENDRPPQAAALIEKIMSLGYKLYWHCPPMFRPDNYFRQTTNVFGNIVSVNMLCLDRETGARPEGLREILTADSDWREG